MHFRPIHPITYTQNDVHCVSVVTVVSIHQNSTEVTGH